MKQNASTSTVCHAAEPPGDRFEKTQEPCSKSPDHFGFNFALAPSDEAASTCAMPAKSQVLGDLDIDNIEWLDYLRQHPETGRRESAQPRDERKWRIKIADAWFYRAYPVFRLDWAPSQIRAGKRQIPPVRNRWWPPAPRHERESPPSKPTRGDGSFVRLRLQ